MTSTAKPILVLGFANDRDDRAPNLRNLAEKARQVQRILVATDQRGLCELVVRQNALTCTSWALASSPRGAGERFSARREGDVSRLCKACAAMSALLVPSSCLWYTLFIIKRKSFRYRTYG